MNANLANVSNIRDLKTAEMIDLLWLKGNKIVAAIEVESTTTMTSGLARGSNLPADVPKYLAIPEEREDQFNRKMKSPMFSERFELDSWKLLFFDGLRSNYKKLISGSVSIEKLTDSKMKAGVIKESEAEYSLFS